MTAAVGRGRSGVPAVLFPVAARNQFMTQGIPRWTIMMDTDSDDVAA